eukprot:COSAG02_NODE_25113_length_668_cov_14.107206_1_plen_70_part_10
MDKYTERVVSSLQKVVVCLDSPPKPSRPWPRPLAELSSHPPPPPATNPKQAVGSNQPNPTAQNGLDELRA